MFDDDDDDCDVEISVCLLTFLGHTSSQQRSASSNGEFACVGAENIWRARAHTSKVENENKECVIFIYTRKEKKRLPTFRRQNLVGGGAFFVETC